MLLLTAAVPFCCTVGRAGEKFFVHSSSSGCNKRCIHPKRWEVRGGRDKPAVVVTEETARPQISGGMWRTFLLVQVRERNNPRLPSGPSGMPPKPFSFCPFSCLGAFAYRSGLRGFGASSSARGWWGKIHRRTISQNVATTLPKKSLKIRYRSVKYEIWRFQPFCEQIDALPLFLRPRCDGGGETQMGGGTERKKERGMHIAHFCALSSNCVLPIVPGQAEQNGDPRKGWSSIFTCSYSWGMPS